MRKSLILELVKSSVHVEILYLLSARCRVERLKKSRSRIAGYRPCRSKQSSLEPLEIPVPEDRGLPGGELSVGHFLVIILPSSEK